LDVVVLAFDYQADASSVAEAVLNYHMDIYAGLSPVRAWHMELARELRVFLFLYCLLLHALIILPSHKSANYASVIILTDTVRLGDTFAVMEAIRLKDLAQNVREAIESLAPEYWVVAELSQVNVNRRSGHCYLDLVDKSDDELLAQMRATIWKWSYGKIAAKFDLATGSELASGMKVLLLVEVRFHEVYGLSLNVKDIDPSFTLGDMERKRRETIARLEKEGILDKNSKNILPLLPTRLAVVSSETAAGFGDFLNTLKDGGYGFKITFYDASMQGEQTEGSVIAALKAIKGKMHEFDAVVIIRGGGSQVDLSYFDSYAISKEVAMFPIPVLAGIGHERDESVVDLVAHTRLITPTAVAEFLVGRLAEFEARVDESTRRLVQRARELMADARHKLRYMTGNLVSESRSIVSSALHVLHIAASGLSSASRELVAQARGEININRQQLLSGAGKLITRRKHALQMQAGGFQHLAISSIRTGASRLRELKTLIPKVFLTLIKGRISHIEALGSSIRLIDPVNVLRRGYSITLKDGMAVTDSAVLLNGDKIITRLAKGSVQSVVEDKGKE
jgi:exodeoxyribonuclease VII large subunit